MTDTKPMTLEEVKGAICEWTMNGGLVGMPDGFYQICCVAPLFYRQGDDLLCSACGTNQHKAYLSTADGVGLPSYLALAHQLASVMEENEWQPMETCPVNPGEPLVFRQSYYRPNSSEPDKVHYHYAVGTWVQGEYEHPLHHWSFEESFMETDYCDGWLRFLPARQALGASND